MFSYDVTSLNSLNHTIFHKIGIYHSIVHTSNIYVCTHTHAHMYFSIHYSLHEKTYDMRQYSTEK